MIFPPYAYANIFEPIEDCTIFGEYYAQHLELLFIDGDHAQEADFSSFKLIGNMWVSGSSQPPVKRTWEWWWREQGRRILASNDILFRAISGDLDVNACQISILSDDDISSPLGFLSGYNVLQTKMLVSTILQDDVNGRTRWMADTTTWIDSTRTAVTWAVHDTDGLVLVAGDIGRHIPWPEDDTFGLRFSDVGLLDVFQPTNSSMEAIPPRELWESWC